ncbi:MAG TPA: hypothetical protein VF756_05735 [Thermoanaerobaculia bacterium]
MDCSSRALSADCTILKAQGRRGGPPRALYIGALVLLALVLNTGAAQAQSCVGKVAGDVCRPSAGACDVAETCVAPVASGVPMYQPTSGTLHTDVAWSFNMGYAFTPNKTLTVTALGGFFNGTKGVYLYNRSTGAVLASATVTAANSWGYATISPVTLNAGTSYSVAVYLAGSGAAYRSGVASMPRALADATIEGSCYRSSSTAEPCGYSGLISTTHYGMADFKYAAGGGGSTPLYQPADGSLATGAAYSYNMGYGFTPNKTLTVNALGGFFNGTKTVYLYNRSTGAVLASASVTSANNWAYTSISPVTLAANTPYTVSVYLAGSGGAYRNNMSSIPSTLADARIDGTCYRSSSTAEPCASSGLQASINYGMADIKYTAGTGATLVCPADLLRPAGTSCRAASGSCDVAETCNGSSAACPANAFVASGIACNDGALCTYNDVCNGAGSCGGTTITCGGGNACSTTMCNGTSTCEPAKVYCTAPPGECYNTLGTCNTSNGACTYTVRTGAPCGTRGTCQSSGTCYTPPPVANNSEPTNCASQTLPVPTPIGCESCDPSRPCVVDSTITVPVEFQTCSGYTPRKGDVVLHEAEGLTRLLVRNFESNWTHIGVFLDPQPPGSTQNQQLVRHHALNMDGLSNSVIRADRLKNILIGLSLNKNSAYCKSAKLDPATLLDQGFYIPGVPSSHTADMTTEPDGGNSGGQFWRDGVVDRAVVIAANRAAGHDVANRMSLRNDYYSLNSLVDWAKGFNRTVNGKPGTNCASAIMSCITPSVPSTLLQTDKMRNAARAAYEAIRRQVRRMDETEDAVDNCKTLFGCIFGLPCPVDCDGIAWEVSNGIADQIIACILFGPTSGGCECTRDNRKWHYAAWSSSPYSPPTQDDVDWVNGRMTDIEFIQDTWTGSAASGQPPITIYPSNTYLPGDVLRSGNYPASNMYYLKRKTNAVRKYGHCYAPLGVTSTMSPSAAYHGTTLTWTATASGGDPATTQYAFFRRKGGTANWIPDVTTPAWQNGNSFNWTPTAGETGYWDTYVWVKDSYTPASMNTYGYAAGYNTGGVQIVAPPTVSGTGSPASSNYGTPINWTVNVSGGTQTGIRYAVFRRHGGTSNWIPDVWAPDWKTSNVLSWTPGSGDVASWEIYIWVKDSATPANMNTYGYAAGYNAGVVQVTSTVMQAHPPKGWVDGYNTQHIWGWACDPDYPTESNRVDFWSTSGQGLGSAGAYIASSSAINSACGGGTAHYFDFYPTGGLPSGTRFNVWSIDLPYATPGNDNRKIGGNGAVGDGTEFVIP